MTRALTLLMLLAPLGGCWIVSPCGGSYDCPEPEPVERGVFAIQDADPSDWSGGVLDIGEDDVIVAWTDAEGNQFEAVYAIVGETPDADGP